MTAASDESGDEFKTALSAWCNRRSRDMMLTLTCKLISKSRWREDALIEAFEVVTQVEHDVLLKLAEDPDHYQAGRAFDLVTTALQTQQKEDKGKITQIIGNMLDTRFSYKYPKKDPNDPQAKPQPKYILNDADRPIIELAHNVVGTLRLGAFRHCGLMIVLWYDKVIQYLAKHDGAFAKLLYNEQNERQIVVPERVHKAWATARKAYDDACSTMIPFGYHREKRFDQVQKRELRRLKKQLPSIQTIQVTLDHIAVLLNRDMATPAAIETAKEARHPWRIRKRQQRRILVSYQHQRPQHGRPTKLGLLSMNELERLQQELEELQSFAEYFDTIRSALDLFLAPALPKFPTINHAIIDPEEEFEAYRKYDQSLEWFRSPFPQHTRINLQHDDETRFFKLEQAAIARLDADGHAFDPIRYQPLRYMRTMRGNASSFFGLLYNADHERFVLALRLNPLGYSVHGIPQSPNNLVFVNAPYTPFRRSQDKKGRRSLVMVGLELGVKYQLRILKHVMHDQAGKQWEMYTAQAYSVRTKPDTTFTQTFPDSAIGTLMITHQQNNNYQPEFFAYIPVTIPIPPLIAEPTTILGIHERDGSYYGILIDKENQKSPNTFLIEVDNRVQPKDDDRWYSDNFAYAVARKIIELAHTSNALIGIEDTTWKRIATDSRTMNRRNFALPRQRILDILIYKALLAGLARPVIIYGISPSQDCSVCGYRPRADDEKNSTCTTFFFTCGRCHSRLTPTDNTTRVVAQQTHQSLIHAWKAQQKT